MARIFGQHPETIRRTFTLREALKHINFEIEIWEGKPSITTASKPKKPDLATLRSEAAMFFKRHAQEDEDGKTL